MGLSFDQEFKKFVLWGCISPVRADQPCRNEKKLLKLQNRIMLLQVEKYLYIY